MTKMLKKMLYLAFAAGYRCAESNNGNTEEPEALIRVFFAHQWEDSMKVLEAEE